MNLRSRLLIWGQKRIEKGAWFFAPLSFCWAVVSYIKNALYDFGFFKAEKVSCPVVSVGNLVAGGSGKTPFVHLLAKRLENRRIAILSRPYGKNLDEPLLLQRRLKNARVYVGKDRVALAKRAAQEGAELIILDDGFQYRKLFRDLDLVMLSASDPYGKGHFLPWGFLRDSPNRLKKADAIFVTGEGEASKLASIGLTVRVDEILGSDGKIFKDGQGMNAAIFSGIAKPHLFKKTVESFGAKVVKEWILADHEKPELKKLQEFAEKSHMAGAKAIFCTEKDIVKWGSFPPLALPLYYLKISLQVVRGEDEWEKLIAKIEEKIDTFGNYEQRN